jgi:hypothetical protein
MMSFLEFTFRDIWHFFGVLLLISCVVPSIKLRYRSTCRHCGKKP